MGRVAPQSATQTAPMLTAPGAQRLKDDARTSRCNPRALTAGTADGQCDVGVARRSFVLWELLTYNARHPCLERIRLHPAPRDSARIVNTYAD